MVKKFLQGAGLLAIVAWTVAGGVAWMVVKDRVQVTVEAASATHGEPDPVSLLRDEVRMVHADLQALAGSLSTSLQALADAQESRCDQQGSTATQQYHQLAKSVRELRAAVDGLAAAASAPAAPAADLVAETVPETTPEETLERTSEPEPMAAPTVAEEPTPRRRPSFLAFTLPSQSFSFDAEQELVLIPRLSRVGFDAKSTLHDFSGVTSTLEGSLTTNLAAPEAKCLGAVKAAAGSLITGLEGRDEAMYEHLDTAKHRWIEFEIASFGNAVVDPKTQRVEGDVRGAMTIRGVRRDFSMPVVVSVDADKRVVVEGSATLKLTDYGVPVPSKLGLISMEDEVKIWIALRLRRAAGAGNTVGAR